MPTKLIEVALPLDAINKEAAREKSIRHGHPSTLHLWWARRPLAACRAVLFAQLVDDPSAHPEQFPTEMDQDRERRRLFDIIERLVPWEATKDEKILEEARGEIRRCYPDGLPLVVDPFCGGGSIPIEAQRLGLEVIASDLNPVAVLITKALTELPPKFTARPPIHPDSGATLLGTQAWRGVRGLADDVRYYCEWMRDEAQHKIGYLYPTATTSAGQDVAVIAWLWARTVTCPSPACRSTMPLARSFWLAKKKGKETWIRVIAEPDAKRVRFEIAHGSSGPPVEFSVNRVGAICLVCEAPVPREYLWSEGRAHRIGAQLMAMVIEGKGRRFYLPPNELHELAAEVSRPDDFPDSEMPDSPRWFSPPMYGMTHHADLFTNRQLAVLCTFSELISMAREKVLTDSGGDVGYADAIATYLAFGVDKLSLTNTTLATWQSNPDRLTQAFSRQAIPMTWDFAEANPFSAAGGGFILTGLAIGEVLDRIYSEVNSTVGQADATTMEFRSGVICTDPPYYDNIGYADLSDYMYIWLRRSLKAVYPDLLTTLLTPKAGELIAAPARFDGNKQLAEEHFERGFSNVFSSIASQESSDTPITIFYAFKQSETESDSEDGRVDVASTGWEKMLEGLIRSGLVVIGTWPMRTELVGNLKGAINALASSIVLVCRPRPESANVIDRRGFIQTLKSSLGHSLRDLQSGGVAPVDLAQAAIGPGMAVFSSSAKVIEPDGSAMRVRTALALINQVLDEVTAEQEGEFDEDTRWAIAWYSEHGFDEGSYGRADDLSRAKNVSVAGLVRAGIVKSGGGKVRLLERDELDPSWDPASDSRLTVWEVTQHLVRRLLNDGESSAAELLSKVGSRGDAARDLAYRLFLIAESKKWSKEAGPYNALAASWLAISKIADAGPSGQGSLFDGKTDGGQ